MKTYSRAQLTGGTSAALDGIDGADLIDGDRAIVITSDRQYFMYVLDSTSGAAEDPPDVIAPDLNAGDKRWLICTLG